MRMRWVAPVLGGLLACAHAPTKVASAPTEPPPGTTIDKAPTKPPALLPIDEILRRMKASPVSYEFVDGAPLTDEQRSQLAGDYWGRAHGVFAPVVEVGANGEKKISDFRSRPEVDAVLEQAEAAYERHDFAAAAAVYDKALAIDPRDYRALVAKGECEAYQQHFDEAFAYYQRAIDVLPAAHVAWEYKGELLLALGRREEALDAYARALALKPRWEPLLAHVRNRQGPMGVRLAPDRLLPAVQITEQTTKDGESVRIEIDRDHPAWVGFGACKAFWKAEPSHRKEELGFDRPVMSTAEERECLAALLASYLSLKDQGKASDPALDQVEEIAKAGAANELLLYEVLSRADGNLGAKLPEDELEKLTRFVRWYVLVDRPAAEH